MTNVVSEHEVYESGFEGPKSCIAMSIRVFIMGCESWHIYKQEAIGWSSFSSSSFSWCAIELNSIRYFTYVFLSIGLLYVIAWMRRYIYASGRKGEFDVYLGFMVSWVCVEVNFVIIWWYGVLCGYVYVMI